MNELPGPSKIETVRLNTVCLTCGDDIWFGERAYAVCGGFECLICRARNAAPELYAALDAKLGGER